MAPDYAFLFHTIMFLSVYLVYGIHNNNNNNIVYRVFKKNNNNYYYYYA